MDKSKILKQLMGTFLEELEEHVRAFNADLLALEKDPPPPEQAERFKTLFRTAHSLKGAARSVNVDLIEAACHCLEEILSGMRDGQRQLDAELFELLFATVDAIEESGMRLREQQDLADAPLAGLLPRLQAAAAGTSAPPAPARPASVEPAPESAAVSTSVRVPAEKLDTLLARVGELLVAQRRVEARAADLAGLVDFVELWKTDLKRAERTHARTPNHAARLAAHVTKVIQHNTDNLRQLDKALQRLRADMVRDSRLLEQVTRPLDDDVRRVRMLPFSEACAGLDRMVRDLAHSVDKEVALVIEGGAVEMDRSILEGLKDPLRHLVRNAVDHGVEAPTVRLDAGKPRQARIKVSACLRGAQVDVHVEDDGRGLDLDAIRTQARRRKLDEPADERDLARLIFHAGFSTASIITDVSGRGVGLDVVKNRVEGLHGAVDLSFAAGQGTRFTLTVPLTLTTLRAVLVAAGGQQYAFAGTNVQKVVRVAASEIRTVAGREVLTLDGTPLPLAPLAAIVNPSAVPHGPNGRIPVIVISAGATRMAYSVDELLTEQEIVIKNLGARIKRAPLVAGATLLPSGAIALVLNAANLVRAVLQRGAVGLHRTPTPEKPAVTRKRLLIVEDSLTTRTLMKSIMEAAGYDVATAVDGQDAWQHLVGHEVDLVVSDVDMPRMDGFELTEKMRASKKTQALPIVLVTARESDSDKARGVNAGADAYLVKSAFDQRNLLETVAQLL